MTFTDTAGIYTWGAFDVRLFGYDDRNIAPRCLINEDGVVDVADAPCHTLDTIRKSHVGPWNAMLRGYFAFRGSRFARLDASTAQFAEAGQLDQLDQQHMGGSECSSLCTFGVSGTHGVVAYDRYMRAVTTPWIQELNMRKPFPLIALTPHQTPNILKLRLWYDADYANTVIPTTARRSSLESFEELWQIPMYESENKSWSNVYVHPYKKKDKIV